MDKELVIRMVLPWWVKPLAFIFVLMLGAVERWVLVNPLPRSDLWYIAPLLLAAWARERQEDERMMEIRKRCALYTVLTIPLMSILQIAFLPNAERIPAFGLLLFYHVFFTLFSWRANSKAIASQEKTGQQEWKS